MVREDMKKREHHASQAHGERSRDARPIPAVTCRARAAGTTHRENGDCIIWPSTASNPLTNGAFVRVTFLQQDGEQLREDVEFCRQDLPCEHRHDARKKPSHAPRLSAGQDRT